MTGCNHTCPVCCQRFDDIKCKPVVYRPCFHVMCNTCDKLLAKRECPVCRKQIKYMNEIYFTGSEWINESIQLLIKSIINKLKSFIIIDNIEDISLLCVRLFCVFMLINFSYGAYILYCNSYNIPLIGVLMIILVLLNLIRYIRDTNVKSLTRVESLRSY